MNDNNVLAQMQTIFRDVFDDEGLTIEEKTCANDIEDWDSLAQITLIVAFEKEFKVKFSLQELAILNDVGDMVKLIAGKVA